MNKKDLNLIKEEFNQDRKKWTDIRLQRTFYFHDLKIRLAEREFHLGLFFTSISVAFLAIVLPLSVARYKFSKITVIGFIISSALGFVGLLLSIIFDHKVIPKHEKEEIGVYKKCQKEAVKICGKIHDGNITEKDVKDYLTIVSEAGRNTEQEDWEKIFRGIIQIISWLFLISFFFAFLSLFRGIIHYLWLIQ